MPYSKELRIRQSRAELDRLLQTLGTWERRRRDADRSENQAYRGQYQSQVAAIVAEIRGAAAAIEGLLKAASTSVPTTPLAEVFQQCARHDRRIIWLWRAFDYYREKFDQRDDDRLGPALRAADEVLWSCYKPFFKSCGIPMPAPPLPFIEDTYSPTALRPNEAGHLEKEAAIDDGPLKPFFQRLPIPLLQLPPMVVTAPWMLVLIGHETGHFVQGMIPAPNGYPSVFRERVKGAARSVRGSDEDAAVWGRWAPEIFADLYSVAVMGPWAVWTMAQFELARPGTPTTRGTDYPSPLARVALLREFAINAGFPDTAQLLAGLGFDADQAAGSDEAEADLKVARQVGRLIGKPLADGGPTLPAAVGLQIEDYRPKVGLGQAGDVCQWADTLLGRENKPVETTLPMARLVSAGAAEAWKQITEMPEGGERDAAYAALVGAAYVYMIRCAEPGTRAAPLPAALPTAALAAQRQQPPSLARIVTEMDDQTLFE